jgi:hypothetical protein
MKWSDVRVPDSIVARIRELPVLERGDVYNTILRILGARSSWPFPFHAPGDPPDTTYSGLEPFSHHAPAVIYRRALRGEDGVWRVVDLMDRQAFRDLTRGGLGDNPFVQGVATAVAAAGTVSLSGTGQLLAGGPVNQAIVVSSDQGQDGPADSWVGGTYEPSPSSGERGTS